MSFFHAAALACMAAAALLGIGGVVRRFANLPLSGSTFSDILSATASALFVSLSYSVGLGSAAAVDAAARWRPGRWKCGAMPAAVVARRRWWPPCGVVSGLAIGRAAVVAALRCVRSADWPRERPQLRGSKTFDGYKRTGCGWDSGFTTSDLLRWWRVAAGVATSRDATFTRHHSRTDRPQPAAGKAFSHENGAAWRAPHLRHRRRPFRRRSRDTQCCPRDNAMLDSTGQQWACADPSRYNHDSTNSVLWMYTTRLGDLSGFAGEHWHQRFQSLYFAERGRPLEHERDGNW